MLTQVLQTDSQTEMHPLVIIW